MFLPEDYPLIAKYYNEVLNILIPGIDIRNHRDAVLSSSEDSFGSYISLSDIGQSGSPYECLSGTFVHFTSIRALYSILNDGYFRMYDLNNANDNRELYTAKELGIQDIEGYKQNYCTLSMCYKEILDSDNALDIWRLYGHVGSGACIELEVKNLDNHNGTDYNLTKITYDIPQKDIDCFKLAHNRFIAENKCKIDINNILTHISIFYKSSLFRTENEVRLALNRRFVDSDSPVYGFDYNKNKLTYYYRIPLEMGGEKTPCISIKSIMFGFKYSEGEVDRFREQIFRDLKRHIKPPLEIVKCNLPYNII